MSNKLIKIKENYKSLLKLINKIKKPSILSEEKLTLKYTLIFTGHLLNLYILSYQSQYNQ